MFPVEGSLATNINWSNSFGRKAVPFVVSNCSMTSLLKYPLPSESKTLNAYQNSNHKFIGEEKEKENGKGIGMSSVMAKNGGNMHKSDGKIVDNYCNTYL